MSENQSRIAVVTGASSGIGRSVAQRLAKDFGGIILHARSSRQKLEELAAELAALGVESEVVLGDLAQAGTGQSIVEAASRKFGRLDVLVANAGFPTAKAWHEGTMEDIDYALRGNLVSFFELTKSAHGMLVRAASPRIVSVGSFTSFLFRNDLQQYPISAASKGGLVTATKSMAAAFAADGITVNCVVPGYIAREPSPAQKIKVNQYKEIEARIPFGRMGRPDEVAAMIEFLVSEDASYITGQAIHVNGGLV